MPQSEPDAALNVAHAGVREAAQALRQGQLVGFPTETVYGLGADASQAEAVAAIYRVKGRPTGHPLIVHVSSVRAAQGWAQWSDAAQRLADLFWPGPLTLILPRRADAPAWACGGQTTVGLRCPAHPIAQALLQQFEAMGGQGVAAPSANRFGRISPTTAAHVRADLGQIEPLHSILDGGIAEVGVESTIVDLSGAQPALLRPGRIRQEAIEAALGSTLCAPSAASPQVSGSLASHYAPQTPVELIAAPSFAFRLGVIADTGERYAVWARRDCPQALLARANLLWYRAPESPEQTEQLLYSSLRELDLLACERIIIESPPAGSEWTAVLDRLRRSATRR